MTKTKTQKKCLKHPTYAIFLKSWWLTRSKYDDRYLTLVILFTPVTLVTLVTLFQSYIQFYRAECITVSGFFPPFITFSKGLYFICLLVSFLLTLLLCTTISFISHAIVSTLISFILLYITLPHFINFSCFYHNSKFLVSSWFIYIPCHPVPS